MWLDVRKDPCGSVRKPARETDLHYSPDLPTPPAQSVLQYLDYFLAHQPRILGRAPGQKWIVENSRGSVSDAAVILAVGPDGITKDKHQSRLVEPVKLFSSDAPFGNNHLHVFHDRAPGIELDPQWKISTGIHTSVRGIAIKAARQDPSSDDIDA